MPNLLDDFPMPVTCIMCGKEQTKSLAWLKAHDHIACPHCGNLVGLERNQFNAALKEAEKALAKLGVTFTKR